MPLSPIGKTLIRIFTGYIFAMALAAPTICLAEEGQPPAAEGKGLLDMLDEPRDYLSQSFVSLSNRVDGFFGDERVFQESSRSYLRFYGDLVFQRDGTSNFNPQLQAKVILPALQKRLHLLIETNNGDETAPAPISDVTTQKGIPSVNTPRDFLASLQVLLRDTLHWNINTDAGIRIHSFAFDPFVRARASHVRIADDWQFRLSESLYWFEQSGAGESTQFDADRKLSDRYLARSRTIATWSDHDQQFYFQQSFILYHPISNDRAMSYQANIFGENKPNSHVAEYDVSAAWRFRLHREWLFFSVAPGISWPETASFHITPTILLRLEAIFGDVACGCYGI